MTELSDVCKILGSEVFDSFHAWDFKAHALELCCCMSPAELKSAFTEWLEIVDDGYGDSFPSFVECNYTFDADGKAIRR